jgi:histidinol dehydrogenase
VKKLVWSDLSETDRKAALARPRGRSDPALQQQVRAIVDDVRARGWEAAAEHALRIDGEAPQRVAVQPIAEEARRTLTTEQLRAIELARRNVAAFHKGSLPAEHEVETVPGLTVRKIWRPLDRVGLYVPGGKTPLFSTLMMLAIPAAAAGVREIVVVTPPRPEGGLDPVVALAADLCGIATIWTIGGAQAIAALAWGAGEIPATPKICGPGNAWVAEAKTYAASLPGGPAIDMPAGPSELLVIADADADPRLVATDLLSQAEHDEAAQVILVTNAPALAEAAEAEVNALLATLPRRAIASAALENARILLTETLGEAVEIANRYAPEHLSLAVADPDALLGGVCNAGAVFAGHYAAETFGDYLAGSSHVLPTDGAARAWGGISVYSFLKAMTVQTVSREAARAIARPAAALARLEGLEAHARAADARLLPPLPFGGGDRGVGDVVDRERSLERVAGTSPTPTPPLKGRGL